MKKSEQILVLSIVMAAASVIIGELYAFDQKDLDGVIATKQCEKCQLAGADLSGVNLQGARLNACYLSGANLGGANLALMAIELTW